LFVLQHAAVLVLLLVIAAATGTAVAGARVPLALRSALGLAVAGQVFAILAALGVFRPWTICIFAAISLVGVRRIAMRWEMFAAVPLFVLALYPPIAFDETLYHLPFVRAIAGSGAIRFLSDVRFPVFPQIHELLCVPALLVAGDVATHLVAVAEVLVLAAVLIAWPRQRHTGFLAAALVLGNPIVLQMGTVTHVELALTLFIAAGAWCIDRAAAENPTSSIAAAGFLFGTACSVKYLGWYFAAAAFVYLVLFGRDRRRTIPIFLLTFALAVVPMYACLVALTGNPLFPFLPQLLGSSPWNGPLNVPLNGGSKSIVRALRLFWDITFAREHVGQQPPYSPLFAVALLVTQYLEQRIPEYRALERRGTGRIYVCGAEQLKDYVGADLLGDVYGPLSNEKIIASAHDAAELSANLARINVRYLLVSRRRCPSDWQRLPASPAFELVYADEGASLWRVGFFTND